MKSKIENEKFPALATSTKNIPMTSKKRLEVEEVDEMDFETSANVQIISSFEDLSLNEQLLRGIYAYGTTKRFM